MLAVLWCCTQMTNHFASGKGATVGRGFEVSHRRLAGNRGPETHPEGVPSMWERKIGLVLECGSDGSRAGTYVFPRKA